MIREPYQVYPYNTVIPFKDKNTADGYSFSVKFGGDFCKKWQVQIVDAEDSLKVYKPFFVAKPDKNPNTADSWRQFRTHYNDQQINFDIPKESIPSTGDFLWRVRLLENPGNWNKDDEGFPTMKMQEGVTEKIEEMELTQLEKEGVFKLTGGQLDDQLIKSKITGSLEEIDSVDLSQESSVTVSLLRDGSPFRVNRYLSKYREYYPSGKGGFKIGKIARQSSTAMTFDKIVKTISSTSGNSMLLAPDEVEKIPVSRADLGLSKILLRDASGIYSSEGLFSEAEFQEKCGNSTIQYGTVSAVVDKDKEVQNTARVLTENGFTVKEIPLFTLLKTTTLQKVGQVSGEAGEQFQNVVLRKSIGLPAKIYLQYEKKDGKDTVTKEISRDDLFTIEEINLALGITIESAPESSTDAKKGGATPETSTPSDSTAPKSDVEKVILTNTITYEKDGNPIECWQIFETDFSESEETILYSLTEHETKYDSAELTKYRAKEFDEYPIITERPFTRKDAGLTDTILAQDANGNIFSTFDLFTEEEKRTILSENHDWGYYVIGPLTKLPEEADVKTFTQEESSPEEEKETSSKKVEIYKNFYDSNYYYFTVDKTPIVNLQDNYGDIVKNSDYKIKNRYVSFSLIPGTQEKIPTKSFQWTLYRSDKSKPIYTSPKIFSRDIRFEYGSFLSGYTYLLKLLLETQNGGIYEYKWDEMEAIYDRDGGVPTDQEGNPIRKISANANYSYGQDYVSLGWGVQKLSVPIKNEGDGENSFISSNDWNGAISIGGNSDLTYDTVSSEKLLVSRETAMVYSFFRIPRTFSSPSEMNSVLFSLRDSTNRDNYLDFALFANTFEVRRGYEIIVPDEAGGSKLEAKKQTKPLESVPEGSHLFETIKKLWITKKETLKEGFYTLPSANTPEGINKLPGVATLTGGKVDMGRYRFKIFLTDQEAILLQYSAEGKLLRTFKCSFDESVIGIFDEFKIYGPQEVRIAELYKKIPQKGQGAPLTLDQFIEIKATKLAPKEFGWITSSIYDKDKILSIDFDKSINSTIASEEDGKIIGYQIYRNEYALPSKPPVQTAGILIDGDMEEALVGVGRALDTDMIAIVAVKDLTKVNNGAGYQIKDFTAHNKGLFNYEIYPRVEKVNERGDKIFKLGQPAVSNFIYINNPYWLFTSIGRRTDGTYEPIDQWKFMLNVEHGGYQHNVQKVFHLGNSRYPKTSFGKVNYLTTNLSALVGDFKRVHVKKFIDSQQKSTNGKCTASTRNDELTKVYIEKTPILDGINFIKDSAMITIKNQSRRILNYSYEVVTTDTNIIKRYYVIIERAFLNMVPSGAPNDDTGVVRDGYRIQVVKDFENPQNYREVGEYNTYEDTINTVNNWNDFVVDSDLVLVKDVKGNAFIANLSDHSEAYNSLLLDYPTTVSFSITQIGDLTDKQIFGY